MKVIIAIAVLFLGVILLLGLKKKKKPTIQANETSVTIGDLTLTSAQADRLESISRQGADGLQELASNYARIQSPEIKQKINSLMLVTDRILQDAKEDPSDIPQIRQFFSYYLPTTVKLLESYYKLEQQGVDGDTINGTKQNISDMLDTAITAYNKRLDTLFDNQALDVETEIEVMNQMLKREGLTSNPDFK